MKKRPRGRLNQMVLSHSEIGEIRLISGVKSLCFWPEGCIISIISRQLPLKFDISHLHFGLVAAQEERSRAQQENIIHANRTMNIHSKFHGNSAITF